MEEKNKKDEKNFELRSEKVRSIVGQIPSSLVRYGITIIGIVLLFLFVIAYFLPYKQVYSGVATIREIELGNPTDSAETNVLLRFETKRMNEAEDEQIDLQTPKGSIEGRLMALSSVRDTLERQEARCRFKTTDIHAMEYQTVDFRIVRSSGNLLQKILGDLGQ